MWLPLSPIKMYDLYLSSIYPVPKIFLGPWQMLNKWVKNEWTDAVVIVCLFHSAIHSEDQRLCVFLGFFGVGDQTQN